MKRVVINADDCGYSKSVNDHIRNAIGRRKITSTTIMANMEDFMGAINLYKDFSDVVSFGMHLNLTEGKPLLYSQLLLDIGFYIEKKGAIEFNGSSFRRQFLFKEARCAIFKELQAQIDKVVSSGVAISHFDSHHFIHQALFMLPLLPELCKISGITKVRNYRNYMPLSINKLVRNSWKCIIKAQNNQICTTDYFTSFESFYKLKTNGVDYRRSNQVMELMCHPGNRLYECEESYLLSYDWDKEDDCKLISYNEL